MLHICPEEQILWFQHMRVLVQLFLLCCHYLEDRHHQNMSHLVDSSECAPVKGERVWTSILASPGWGLRLRSRIPDVAVEVEVSTGPGTG